MKRLLLVAAEVAAIAAVAACGPSGAPGASADAPASHGGGDGGAGNDGGGTPVDADTFPATITVSGQAISQGESSASPESGVAIGIYASSDDATALATATTDGSGNYAVVVPTNGAPIVGYIKATKSGLVDTYVYPPTPFEGDTTDATASMTTSDDYSELVGVEGASTSNGVVILDVLDATLQPVTGATVSSSPASGEVDYMNSSGEPFATSSTYSDGLAFLFDVPPSGEITLTAAKSGMTFTAHAVTARPGALTTTVLLAQ